MKPMSKRLRDAGYVERINATDIGNLRNSAPGSGSPFPPCQVSAALVRKAVKYLDAENKRTKEATQL